MGGRRRRFKDRCRYLLRIDQGACLLRDDAECPTPPSRHRRAFFLRETAIIIHICLTDLLKELVTMRYGVRSHANSRARRAMPPDGCGVVREPHYALPRALLNRSPGSFQLLRIQFTPSLFFFWGVRIFERLAAASSSQCACPSSSLHIGPLFYDPHRHIHHLSLSLSSNQSPPQISSTLTLTSTSKNYLRSK